MRYLKVVYNGIKCEARGSSASGQVGTFRAVFSFSTDWEAYPTRTAVFVSGGFPVAVVLDGKNECDVPDQITKNGGRILVGAFGTGTAEDGSILRYPGEYAAVNITEGVTPHAAAPTPQDVTAYEQLLARLKVVEEKLENGGGGGGGGIAKETDPTVPDWAKQPEKPEYTASEVGALSASELPNAINTALAQAAESGKFDGEPGHTPERGKDYWTADDLAAMVQDVLKALPTWEGGSY